MEMYEDYSDHMDLSFLSHIQYLTSLWVRSQPSRWAEASKQTVRPTLANNRQKSTLSSSSSWRSPPSSHSEINLKLWMLKIVRRTPARRKTSVYAEQHNTQQSGTYIYTSSGIRIHDPSIPAGEDILYLRPRDHGDRQKLNYYSINLNCSCLALPLPLQWTREENKNSHRVIYTIILNFLCT